MVTVSTRARHSGYGINVNLRVCFAVLGTPGTWVGCMDEATQPLPLAIAGACLLVDSQLASDVEAVGTFYSET